MTIEDALAQAQALHMKGPHADAAIALFQADALARIADDLHAIRESLDWLRAKAMEDEKDRP